MPVHSRRSSLVGLVTLTPLLAIAAPAVAQPSEATAPEVAQPAAPEAAAPASAPEERPAADDNIADAPPAEAPEDAPAPASAPPKPPPYSLPFQLRPVVAGTVLRSDTAFAFYKPEDAPEGGSTIVSTLLFSYKVTPELAPLVRVAMVNSSPPGGDGKMVFVNPALGATYALKLGTDFKLGLFLGATVPIGGGGGNPSSSDDAEARAAVLAGILARSAMDNALFATNYFTIFPGVGFAYVANNLTAQVEATLLQLTRVRGDKVDVDSSRTNFTTGVHLGYFVIPQLSLGAELRHQRWLSIPKPAVAANDNLRDTTTVAVGPRVHIKLGETSWFRPAIVYARGLDKPMTDLKMNIVQLDLPFIF